MRKLDGADQTQVAHHAHRGILHHPLSQMEQHNADDQEAEEVVHPAAGVEHHTEDEEVHPHQQGRVHEVPQLAHSRVHVLRPKVLGWHYDREFATTPDLAQVGGRRRRGGEIHEAIGVRRGRDRVIHSAHPTIVAVHRPRQATAGATLDAATAALTSWRRPSWRQ